MAFRIPGRSLKIRFMDEVATVDDQYDIYDIGIEHENGGIDSIAFGGSAYTLKRVIADLNSKADAKSNDVVES